MKVIIVGGGKTGSHLANLLMAEHHEVKVVDDRPSLIDKLCKEIPTDCLVVGDGSSPTVLEKAGIREANVVAAVTGNDETNLVITSLAKFEFNCPRVIGRVNNPKNAWLFTKDMGVDVSLNQSDILAHLVAEEMSLGDMMTLLKLKRGEYSLVEEKVHQLSNALGKSVRDLQLPSDCNIVAIIRNHELMIPNGSFVFEANDEVLALGTTRSLPVFASMLAKPE